MCMCNALNLQWTCYKSQCIRGIVMRFGKKVQWQVINLPFWAAQHQRVHPQVSFSLTAPGTCSYTFLKTTQPHFNFRSNPVYNLCLFIGLKFKPSTATSLNSIFFLPTHACLCRVICCPRQENVTLGQQIMLFKFFFKKKKLIDSIYSSLLDWAIYLTGPVMFNRHER